jgi:hypothetical protein
LDYSVAKGGFLCAYRWQGEQQLNNEHFVWTTDNRRPGDRHSTDHLLVHHQVAAVIAASVKQVSPGQRPLSPRSDV